MYDFEAKAFCERDSLEYTCFTYLDTGNQLQQQNHPEMFHGGLISERKVKT